MDNLTTKLKEQKKYFAKTVTNSEEGNYLLKYDELIHREEYIYGKDKVTGKDYFIRKNKLETIVNHYSITLNEVNKNDLAKARSSKTPGFIYKKNGKLYYAAINSKLYFGEFSLGENMHHKCSFGNKDCNRLSPLPYSMGGCEKVSDIKLRIEKYPFVTDGYEVFNTKNTCMVVLSCTHFEQTSERKKDTAFANKAKQILHTMYFSPNLLKSDSEDDEIFPMNEITHRKKYW